MKNVICASKLALAVLFVALGAENASALPSFARQTGLNCAACHAGGEFPALTDMGRQFKLTGYTMGGGHSKMPIPLSAMVQASFSSTKSAADAVQSTNGVNENNKLNFPQMSLFYGGKIYGNLGAFIQMTYDSSDLPEGLTTTRIGSDNTDIRYGDTASVFDTSLIYGGTLNNNPTVQDPYSSTPAWGFPWASPELPAETASPMIEQVGGAVVGLTAYGLYDDTLYAEFGGYQDATTRNDVFKNLAIGADALYLNGTAPYGRIALQHTSGNNFMMIGGYGMQMNMNQTDGAYDTYTDMAIDGEYQYIVDKHALTITARNTWEKQKLDATAPGSKPSLSAFSGMAGYVYDNTYGLNVGYQSVSTSGYAAANISENPGLEDNSRIWIAQAEYTPIPAVRLVAQEEIFTELNGQTGSAASDNNTFSLGAWLMF